MAPYDYYYDDYYYDDYVVYAGQTMESISLYGEDMTVLSGGVANEIWVGKYGCLTIEAGGTATNVHWTPGVGYVCCEPGCSISFADSIYGVYYANDDNLLVHQTTMGWFNMTEREDDCYDELYVMYNGYATDISMYDETTLHVWYGGHANNIAVHDASMVFVENGGLLTNVVSDGDICIEYGGVANNITITVDSWLDVSSGGVLNGLTITDPINPDYDPVATYGYRSISFCEGSVVTGFVRFNNIGNNLRVEPGAIFDFNLTLTNPEYYALLDNLSVLSETQAAYTLTTDAVAQTHGTYVLAGGASGFDKTISVVDCHSYQNVGTLTVGGTTNVNGTNYLLYISNDVLYLSVGGTNTSGDTFAPTFTGIWASPSTPTNQNVTVTATFWDDVAVSYAEYRIGQYGAWQTYVNGVTVTQNDTVYFRVFDTSNNVSESSFTVSNIDKTFPTISNITADTMAPASRVTLTATFDDNAGLATTEYRIGANGYWQTYGNRAVISQNATVYFRAVDSAGNETTASYNVTNISESMFVRNGIRSVSPGQTSTGLTLVYGGRLDVSSGGVANDTLIPGGILYVSSGGIVNRTSLSGEYYSRIVSSGGTSRTETGYSYGDLFVSSGGTANDTYVSAWCGALVVYSGGVVNNSEIDNGSLNLSGGTANKTAVVNSDSYLNLGSGGAANSTTVKNGGQLSIGDGVANYTAIESGGEVGVGSGGTANSVTVASFGFLYVYSGGKLTGQTKIADGAFVRIDQGATIDFDISNLAPGTDARINDLSRFSGWGYADYTLSVSGTQASGSYTLANGASAFDKTITVVNASVNGLQPRTLAVGQTVSFGGRNYTLNLNGDSLYVTVTVDPNADMIPPTVSNIRANTTAVTEDPVTVTAAFSDDKALELSLYRIGSNGTWQNYSNGVTVSENATVYFKAVDSAGNESPVASYAVTNISSNTIVSNGTRIISSGKTASDLQVYYGGGVQVQSDGTAVGAIVNYGGDMDVLFGGRADNATIYSSGRMDVYNGGIANNATVNYYGNIYVYYGGIVNNATVNHFGFIFAMNGGVANDTILNSGFLYIYSSSIANNTLISCGGITMSGGTATNTTVVDRGGFFVFSNAIANDTVVSGASIIVISATANSTTIESGGIISASAGGIVNSTTISSGGTMLIRSGGTANNTILNDSKGHLGIEVSGGGIANSTTLNCGNMYIRSGGTANNVRISSGGYLNINSGGKLTGQLNIAYGGSAYAVSGAIIDFDISPLNPGAEARINDLSRVSYWNYANYTLTLSLSQANGSYTLANGASGFNNTITVVDDTYGNGLGTLSVGQMIMIGNKGYSLDLSNGCLSLTVGATDRIPPTVTNVKADITAPTTRSVTVTATFSDNNAVATPLYRIGSSGSWQIYSNGVTVTQNTTIYFQAVDIQGNQSEIVSYTVSNIDKTPPVAPTAYADITTLTNQNVTVTAVFSSDTVKKEYSLDGTNWSEYSSGIIFSRCGYVRFRGTDALGNVSAETVFAVTNIDTDAPTITDISGSPSSTTPTDGGVTVTASFLDYSGTPRIYYSVGDFDSWQLGSSVTVYENVWVNFKAVDAVGNETQPYTYIVSNIRPGISGITCSTEEPTGESVTVTATFPGNASVQPYYKLGENGAWQAGASVTVSENVTVYFKTVDASGNESRIVSHTVSNIDRNAPAICLITGSPSTDIPTDRCVTVSASFTDDSGVFTTYYKLGENGVWQLGSSVTVYENMMVHFKAVDAVGNESQPYTYIVSNIKTNTISGAVVPENESRTVSSGQTYTNTSIESNGCLVVLSGGRANNTTLDKSGAILVSSGGVANNTILNTYSSGYLYVFDGGTANSTTVNKACRVFVCSGGTANDTIINEWGKFDVSSGVANNTTLNTSAWMSVSSGGVANNTMIDSFGSMYISEGGVANGITVGSSGYLAVSNGGTAINTMLNYGGDFRVYSGGVASCTTLEEYSYFAVSDGVADTTTIGSDGRLHVCSGGTAINTTVKYNGYFAVSSGASAVDATIKSGGSLRLSGGATLTGRTTIESGAYVILADESILNFDISGFAPGADARINDLSLISNGSGATYTLTVSDSQENGVYVLAGGAAGFNKSISVMNGSGESLGALSLGEALWIDDVGYAQLGLTENNELHLLVGEPESPDTTPPVVFNVMADIMTPTNQNVVVTAMFSDDVALESCFYRTKRQLLPGISAGSDWMTYKKGVTVTENNTTVYFKAIDTSGNESAEVSYKVTNIDRTPPEKPVVWADVTTETNNPVTVTASFSWDSAEKQYSLDGSNWEKYTSEIKLSKNGTVYFRGIDAAGNISDVASWVVNNIVAGGADLTANLTFFPGDFSGNGKSMLGVKDETDITIYRNKGIVWSGLTMDDGWNLAGVGDFDGDGTDDILRVHDSGLIMCEFSDGYGEFEPQVLNFLNEGWSILGTGDFDGDGADDVLISNPTAASETVGLLGYWAGGTAWTLINGYSSEWECVSTGDFNGDGKCDMLWRNSFEGDGGLTYNAYCTWIVDPPAGQSDWRMVSVANPDEWDFLCSGDFDGNGSHDIAMINGEGVVGIWGVSDGWLSSWSILSAVNPSEWKLAGVSDFDGNGTDDIAWCGTNGQVGAWLVKNKELSSWQTVVNLA